MSPFTFYKSLAGIQFDMIALDQSILDSQLWKHGHLSRNDDFITRHRTNIWIAHSENSLLDYLIKISDGGRLLLDCSLFIQIMFYLLLKPESKRVKLVAGGLCPSVDLKAFNLPIHYYYFTLKDRDIRHGLITTLNARQGMWLLKSIVSKDGNQEYFGLEFSGVTSMDVSGWFKLMYACIGNYRQQFTLIDQFFTSGELEFDKWCLMEF